MVLGAIGVLQLVVPPCLLTYLVEPRVSTGEGANRQRGEGEAARIVHPPRRRLDLL